MHPDRDPLEAVRRSVVGRVAGTDLDNVEALIIEELRRLHEGVLARYGLRPSEFSQWQAHQRQG